LQACVVVCTFQYLVPITDNISSSHSRFSEIIKDLDKINEHSICNYVAPRLYDVSLETHHHGQLIFSIIIIISSSNSNNND